MAGLILTALLVPQGMAYAELAGLPPITGLYTSILCLVGYALFGPSKILVLGPDSSLGPMIAATILPLVGAHGDPARAVALASMLALLVGAMTTLAGMARLGFVADLLSKPTMIGYMNGLAADHPGGPAPQAVRLLRRRRQLPRRTAGIRQGGANGETVGAALAIGLIGLAVILACQRWLPKIPACWRGGPVDRSPPASSTWPTTASRWWAPAAGLSAVHHSARSASRTWACSSAGALGIAVVSLADTISTASSFAARSGDEIDGSREMIGIGAANIAAGFFQGFPVSTSGSRTAVAEQAGRQDPGHRAGRGRRPSP